MAVSATSLPFREQNEFLRRKLNLPTQSWTDIYTREHDYAFVVAGANRDQLVADFRQAVERAIEGGSLEEFRREFDAIVARHGWSYNGGRNWRSRVIYETNLRSSYMAGRYEQLMAVREERPYWQYIHSDAVEHPRPLHEEWNGLVLRWDDPWWQYHFPINAWGCQCSVRALSQRDLERMGKSGPDTAPAIVMEQRTIGQRSPNGPRAVEVPQGIDPGFEYTPGQSRYEAVTPPQQIPPAIPPVPETPASMPMPVPRSTPAQLLEVDDIAEGVLQQLGSGTGRPAVVVRDVIGERLVVGPSLFEQAIPSLPGVTAGLQSQLIVDTLLDADEIWTRIDWSTATGTAQVRRRYIARYRLPGTAEPVVIVLERGADGWWVLPETLTPQQLAALRSGVLLYSRDD